MQTSTQKLKSALEAHKALVAKNANKKLLSLGELKQMQDAQNTLLRAVCEELQQV